MKIRKYLRFYLLAIHLIISIQMWAFDFEVDGIYYNFIPDTEDVEVTRANNFYRGNIEIPSAVTYGEKTYRVTHIEENTFSLCRLLMSIKLPNSIISIGDYAFGDCRALKSITLPNTLEYLGNYAFGGCQILNSLEIPASVTVIGENIFGGCVSLTSINVAVNNMQYASENGVLYDKNKTILICFPKNKENDIFVIPNTVKVIDQYAFENVANLISIEIPNSVETIGRNAFVNCYNLHTVELMWNDPLNVTLQELPFDFSMGNLMRLIVPANTKDLYMNDPVWSNFIRIVERGEDLNFEIEDGILIKYSGTEKNVTIPEDVIVIGKFAFNWWRSFESITFPKSLIDIEPYGFFGCGKLTSITFPESLTNIGEYAFSYCTSLKSIIFPESLTHIGENAFAYCGSLESIRLPESLTDIGDYVFSWCTSLESIHLPESLTNTGEGTFFQCSALESIHFPESLTHIGGNAFSYCTSLDSIFLPKTIIEIGREAFGYCSNIKVVEVEWDTPLRLSFNPFTVINFYLCKLIVPKGMRNLYRKSFVWMNFGKIVEKGGVGITNINTLFNVYFSENMLYVNSAVSETISVYSINGILLYSFEKEVGEIIFPLNNISDKVLIVKGNSGWTKKIMK